MSFVYNCSCVYALDLKENQVKTYYFKWSVIVESLAECFRNYSSKIFCVAKDSEDFLCWN